MIVKVQMQDVGQYLLPDVKNIIIRNAGQYLLPADAAGGKGAKLRGLWFQINSKAKRCSNAIIW